MSEIKRWLLLALLVSCASVSALADLADDEPLRAAAEAAEAESDDDLASIQGFKGYKKNKHPSPSPCPTCPPLPPPCPDCPDGLTKCGNQCLDTKTNPLACGGCGKVCPELPNSFCNNGTCTCDAGLLQCPTASGFVCVDSTTNINYCGNCTTACDAKTQACNNGTCTAIPTPPVCPPGETQCFNGPGPNGCVNLNNNTDYCGSCNRRCRASAIGVGCTDGKCCKPIGSTCLFPGLDLFCCGWNPLSLLPSPIPLATSRCESRGLLGVCCKDINTDCTADSECCTDQECRTYLGSSKCQKNGCKFPTGGVCTSDSQCCAGFKCSNVPILGKRCSPL